MINIERYINMYLDTDNDNLVLLYIYMNLTL